jgi:hypothetical protein
VPNTDEWIKKMWYINRMEYYSAIKKNKIMPFAGKWMELQVITLNEICQVQGAKYHIFAHMQDIK